MNEVQTAKPSSLSAFFGGARTGLFNSAMMMGIFAVVGFVATGALVLAPATAAIAITSTAIFGGIMGIRRNHKEHAHLAPAHDTATLIPVQTHGLGQAIVPQMDLSEAPDMERRTDWAERTGPRHNRMQEILDSKMTDQDRASAILAERERNASASPTIH